MTFKTKAQIAAKQRCHKRNTAKQKITKNNPSSLVRLLPVKNEDSTIPESTTVNNLTEPLLEIIKEEPQLEESVEEALLEIPTAPSPIFNEVMLAIREPKPEPTNPTGADDPMPEVALFCSLCLRPCVSDQVVEFSAEPSWNCLDVASGRDKLALILGLKLELEQSAICRSCWILVETLTEFREGCLKAATWRARFSFGLDGAGDDWMSKENVVTMERTRELVREHVERIEMAEVEARNRQDLAANELPEEKPILEDEQNWVDAASYLNSPEEPLKNDSPKVMPEIVEKMEITAFRCTICQRKFETKLGMKIHFDRCKKSSKTKPFGVKLHTCSVCSANFTHMNSLQEHLNKHSGNKPYVCRKENCNKRFHVSSARINHERKCKGFNSLNQSVDQESTETLVSESADPEKQLEIYACSKCPRRFDTKAGLLTHTQKCKGLVESRQLHSCPICSMEFLHSKQLEEHINKHNGIKPYKCKNNSCGKHFYGKMEQRRHAEICGKDKPICPHCGLQLSTKGALNVHMATHAKELAVECETCGKKFKTRKNLKKHQLVHSDARNYPCGVCGKAFKSADALNVHRRIHTQEKPFSCAVCGQRFAYKCLVGPHVKKCHTGED